MTAKMAALIRRAKKNAESDEGSNDQEHDDLLELIGLVENAEPCEHRFTTIAPEGRNSVRTWQWCIRCGCLKLGREVFSPGEHQKATIKADK